MFLRDEQTNLHEHTELPDLLTFLIHSFCSLKVQLVDAQIKKCGSESEQINDRKQREC